MRINELIDRLEKIGISAEIPPKTVKRWAYQGIIKPPDPARLPGRGHAARWSEDALEEAAAISTVRPLLKQLADRSNTKTSFAAKIREIKETARRVFTSPEVIHELPHDFVLTTPEPSTIYSFQDLATKVVKDNRLNDVVITWIAARAKVRHKKQNEPSVETLFEHENVNDAFNSFVVKMTQLNELSDGLFFEYEPLNERALKWAIGLVNKLAFMTPMLVIVHWYSKLMLAKNPLLKDVPADDFERTLEEEGVLEDDLPDDFEPQRIPVRFRNVPDWLLRQECRIPQGSPTLKAFWDNLPESATYKDISRLIIETTKDWRYLPTGWRFKFDRVELKPSSSDHDELAVFIDGNDSRKKAFYAPFSEYDPYEKYDREHIGRFY
jgi:hypothetical protein